MPFESPFDSPFAPRRPRNVAELLTAEAENELLGSLAGSTLGGLAYVGSSLDKALGGRAVRAGLDMLMGGDTPASELLSIIPFSDALGITDESNAISGRELLDPMLGPNREGFNPLSDPMDALGDVLGFGAEVALDPGTWLTFGGAALTQAGKAAAKTGNLAKATRGLDDVLEMGAREAQIAAGQRSLARARIPFTEVGVNIGTGDTSQAIARFLDQTEETIRYGNLPFTENIYPGGLSPGRAAAAMFSRANRGVYPKAAQIAAQGISEGQRLAGEEALGLPVDVYGAMKREGVDLRDPVLNDVLEGVAGAGGRQWYHATSVADELLDSGLQAAPGRALLEPSAVFLASTPDEALRSTGRATDPGMRATAWTASPQRVISRDSAEYNELARGIYQQAAQRMGIDEWENVAELFERTDPQHPANQLTEALRSRGYQAVRAPVLGGTDEWLELLDPSLAVRGTGNGFIQSQAARLNQAADEAYAGLAGTGRIAPLMDLEGLIDVPGSQIGRHAPRYIPDHPGGTGKSKLLPGKVDSVQHRNESLYDLPRTTVNPMTKNVDLGNTLQASQRFREQAFRTKSEALRLAATNPEQAQELAKQAALLARQSAKLRTTARKTVQTQHLGLTKDDLKGLKAQHQQLADEIANQDLPALGARFPNLQPEQWVSAAEDQLKYLEHRIQQPRNVTRTLAGLPQQAWGREFYNDAIDDTSRYLRQTAQAQVAAEGTWEFLGNHVRVGEVPGNVPLPKVLESLKFGGDNPITNQKVLGVLKKLGVHADQGITANQAMAQLGNYSVPADLADAATKMISGFTQPEATGPILAIYDLVTSAFKTGATTPWPSFHVRNDVTGKWQNYVIGAFSLKSNSLAKRLLRGEAVDEAMQHPYAIQAGKNSSAQEASDFLRGRIYARNVAGQSHTNDITGQFVHPSENFAGNILGEPGAELALRGEHGVLNAIKQGASEAAAGSSNRIASALKGALGGVVQGGHHAGQLVEGTNRAAGFLELGYQGFDEGVAASKVRAAHGDYSNLSDFERSRMRRIIPFYNFSRQMLPEILQELVTRPGGPTGQLAQAASYVREGQDAFLPEYLQGGLGIPVGEEANGNQRFLTGLDLPAEGLFESIHTGPNAITDTGMALLGMTNPLLKVPFEYATGKQFFTGRDLRDLHANTGSVLGDQLIGLTPLARVPSVVNTLTDERKGPLAKGINLLTGARVSDVDVEKYKSILARELIEDELRGTEGVGFFEHLFASPESIAAMTPEQQQMMMLYRQLSNRAQKAAREKKQDQRIGLVR